MPWAPRRIGSTTIAKVFSRRTLQRDRVAENQSARTRPPPPGRSAVPRLRLAIRVVDPRPRLRPAQRHPQALAVLLADVVIRPRRSLLLVNVRERVPHDAHLIPRALALLRPRVPVPPAELVVIQHLGDLVGRVLLRDPLPVLE